ncbi:MAG: hypothetical protein GY829_01945 [Gammaproteobacteria bacterium]|nr:hypothetical protein [Gammaproteobacteria bacterium]
MRYRLLVILFFSIVFSGFANIQAASKKAEQKKAQVQRNKTIGRSSAMNIAKSEVKGKILSAKLIKSRGPAVYRVKMLVKDKRVRTVFVDGVSGRVIRIY